MSDWPLGWKIKVPRHLGRRWKRNPMRDPLLSQPPEPRSDGRRLTARDRREFEAGDVVALRAQYDMTQIEFARLIGISPETLRNWERGRRCPLGPARALLRVVAADPDKVLAVLRSERQIFEAIEANDTGDPFEYTPEVLKDYWRKKAREREEEKQREAGAATRAASDSQTARPADPVPPPKRPREDWWND